MRIDATVSGPLFDKRIDKTVRNALYQEVIIKVTDRWMRGGKGLGVRRNILSCDRRQMFSGQSLEAAVESTRIWPRTRGTKWTRKNISLAKAMVPRVLRKAASRISGELS